MELVACEWGKNKSFPLPFVEYGATDWLSGVSLELGDIQIAINGGAYVNISLDQLTIVADHVIITLSDSNMQFKYAIVRVKDQTATKVFEDTGAILTTTVQAWYQALFSLLESQRGSHTGVKEMIFWDPVGGSDSGSGLIYSEPKLTYNFNGANGVHDLLNANEHQIIIGLPHATGAPTTVNEYVEVDAAYTFLRCPGRDFLFEATHNEACVLKASAEGVELSGLRVKTKVEGSQDAICASGDFVKMRKLWVDYSRGAGIQINNASHCEIEEFIIQDAAQGGSGHALHILGDTSLAERNIVGAGRIFSNGNGGGGADGVRIDGVNCRHTFITGGASGLYIHDNTGYGIQEVNDADETIIVGPTVHIGHNTLGNEPQLIGSESTAENWQQWAKDVDLQTVIAAIAAIPTEPVNVVGGGGASTPGYAEEGESSSIYQGDVVNIGRYTSGDQTAKRLFFGAKEAPGDTSYVVGVIECTVGAYNVEDDITSYLIPFVADDTKTVTADTYTGQVEIRDADGVSNPVTTDTFDFNVKGEIVT